MSVTTAGSAGLRVSTSSRWVLMLCVAALIFVWAAPASVHERTDWFPVGIHLIAEIFAITVAALVFAVTWHGHRNVQPYNIVALGCAFLAMALLDLAHALSYNGMPVFVTPASPEKAINFWLAARAMLAVMLVSLAFLPWRWPVNERGRVLLLLVTLAGTAGVLYLGLFRQELWPRTFIPGKGLTTFKIAFEWITIAALLVAVYGFWRWPQNAAPFNAEGLLVATLLSALAGLCFTRYIQVNGMHSLVGHTFKILAYIYVYRVMFVTCVRAPYRALEQETTSRAMAEQRVEQMSFHDQLTGLPNLALLEDRTAQALASGRRDHTHVALLFLDLDHFKVINNALGHHMGDKLLCAVARVLVDAAPTTATVCRAGGDEFIVLLPGLPEVGFAAAVLEQIAERLAAPLVIDGQDIPPAASIGVAISPSDGDDFTTLLRNAETAMYTAKQAGRKAWRYYDPAMDAEVNERLQLANSLRLALERNELALHYQLQFDLFSNAVIGAEALLRWHHPELGMVPPDRFIPIAEENGLILPIGAWVLREACRQAAQWRASGVPIPVVAVNIASIQLHDATLVETVKESLQAANLPASALELELTESGLIEDTEQVNATIDALKALGVSLSIDDFGTGYSCLAYLRRLEVDQLKIDKSFVQLLNGTPDGGAIVAAIVQMARTLGLDTLAEGVEDEATAEALRHLGCRHVQGYLYARPLPNEALLQLPVLQTAQAKSKDRSRARAY